MRQKNFRAFNSDHNIKIGIFFIISDVSSFFLALDMCWLFKVFVYISLENLFEFVSGSSRILLSHSKFAL